jgi:DNA-binding response OmpR family regulator
VNYPSVLVVEDNPQDELFTLRALQRAGFTSRVDVVRDGQQALDYLLRQGEYADREGPDLPTVVILDLNLPRLSGLEVLERLRAASRTELLPVVVLTSSDDEQDRLDSYRGGANGYVSKPLDLTEFEERVGRLAVYWLAVNEPSHRGVTQ